MTKYAVVVPCDQTVVYLDADGCYTTEPSEARLLSSEEELRAWCVELGIPPEETVPPEDYPGQNFYSIERVEDEAEFRAGEPTW